MNEVFVLELPLQVENYQADILNKRYEQLRQLYNYVQGKLLRQYRYFEQTKEFQECKTFKAKREFIKAHPFQIKGVLGRNKKLLDIFFDEYGILGLVAKLGQKPIGSRKTYTDMGISSTILANLSDNIWSSWNKKLYDYHANRVSFKKFGELNTFGSGKIIQKKDNEVKEYFPGMVLHLDKMEIDIKTNGALGKKATFITLPILHNPKHADYEMMALAGGSRSIKVLNVVRRLVRGQYKYYLQMTIEGEKPQKGRTLGNGNVGIDLGPTTVAVSGENVVSIDKLASKCDNIQEEITRLSRKIDRSRRANNPQNFNEDGTIKRGIKLVWNDSKRYKELRRELAELRRKQAAIRKQQHIDRANALLKEGDTFIVENNQISGWTTRAKETKVNEKTGKIQKKKRFGKSVANHAPSMFVSILENKVKSLGGEVVKVDTKNAASQYDFTNGSFTKHELKERNVTLSNGDTHQRDMLAAFNLQHLKYDEKDTKQYDTEAMTADYERFCQLEQEEIQRYKNKEKKDDRSTIGAEKL
jgi:transposase